MNVVEPILFQARHNPPAPAMCAPGTGLGMISYARLAQFINNVGRRAVSLGISPGHVVAIQVSDRIIHSAIALGLMHIGVATVSIGNVLPSHLHVDAIITDSRRSLGAPSGSKIFAADFTWLASGGPLDERHIYRGSGDTICRIALTSGSTGEPKAVGFSHKTQLARLARYNHLFGNFFPQYSRFFSDYGLGSSGGFRHMLYVLSRGGTMFFPGATPMDTLQTFELYKVQGLIASPGGLSGFLKFYDANRDFKCGFDVIISAGSPMPESLSERVRARLCSTLIFYYGTTETSTISSAPAHVLTGTPGAVGYVAPDVTVEIVDGNGKLLPPDREGAIRIGSPVSVTGYLDDAEDAQSPFRDGRFYTGDVGYRTRDNLLVITGREKDVLNLGGDKVKPQAIEDAIIAFEGVEQAAVFTAPNELGIDEVWAHFVPNAPVDETALRKHCKEKLAETHVPVRFISVAELPRNTNGKVERSRLRVAALDLPRPGL
jgi:acyl-coenzyme A synthetase/AMP-(fatty) acid ligase